MKKIVVFIILSSLMFHSFAQEVKSRFYPTATDKYSPYGAFGNDKDGAFLCFGTLVKVSQEAVPTYICKGTKATPKDYVNNQLKSKYLGSKYAYEGNQFGAVLYWKK